MFSISWDSPRIEKYFRKLPKNCAYKQIQRSLLQSVYLKSYCNYLREVLCGKSINKRPNWQIKVQLSFYIFLVLSNIGDILIILRLYRYDLYNKLCKGKKYIYNFAKLLSLFKVLKEEYFCNTFLLSNQSVKFSINYALWLSLHNISSRIIGYLNLSIVIKHGE